MAEGGAGLTADVKDAVCDDCGRKAVYTDRRGPSGSIRHFCEDCRANRWEPDIV